MQRSLRAMFKTDQKTVEIGTLTPQQMETHMKAYLSAKLPWDYMSKYYRYKLAMVRRAFIKPKLKEAENRLELPDEHVISENFFYKNNPCLLPRMGKFVDYWIFWEVTQGRFRCNHNKVVKVYKYEKTNDISMLRWAEILKRSTADDWQTLNETEKYGLFLSITDTCNNVLIAIQRRLGDCELDTCSRRVCYQNLNRHPEFVPFQSNRTPAHKQYSWKYQAKKLGGNQGYTEPSRSDRVPKVSIHSMMREINTWLPSLRTRSSPFPQIINKTTANEIRN